MTGRTVKSIVEAKAFFERAINLGPDSATVLAPLRFLPEFDSIYRDIAADMAAQLEPVKAMVTIETCCVAD
jgi:hypothetical protein